ncbi:MAG: hypothetical protein Q8P30_01835 [Candidatus Uhrbacteria bacterium]|nr:hypothetical protein [Candidatus Uhrbacteria bacterium]
MRGDIFVDRTTFRHTDERIVPVYFEVKPEHSPCVFFVPELPDGGRMRIIFAACRKALIEGTCTDIRTIGKLNIGRWQRKSIFVQVRKEEALDRYPPVVGKFIIDCSGITKARYLRDQVINGKMNQLCLSGECDQELLSGVTGNFESNEGFQKLLKIKSTELKAEIKPGEYSSNHVKAYVHRARIADETVYRIFVTGSTEVIVTKFLFALVSGSCEPTGNLGKVNRAKVLALHLRAQVL